MVDEIKDEPKIKEIREKILKWYISNKRNFPWRENNTPYRIMIAEFMLQRTKANQVASVYKNFIKEFPEISDLSEAKIEDIYPFIKKIGLYWRAEHILKSANYIIENFNGKIPDELNKLLKIPGIGEYTAGAILTCAYNKKATVVDSNIARFINRIFNLKLKGEIRRNKKIKKYSRYLFNYQNTRKLTFAILDFTAVICKPREPQCSDCILKNICGNNFIS